MFKSSYFHNQLYYFARKQNALFNLFFMFYLYSITKTRVILNVKKYTVNSLNFAKINFIFFKKLKLQTLSKKIKLNIKFLSKLLFFVLKNKDIHLFRD